MGSNTFGKLFQITTFGESHGKGIGVVIDGCPSNITIDLSAIQAEVDFRRPGFSEHTTQRKEQDRLEILSGVFKGRSTGAPITLFIKNCDCDSSRYDKIKEVYRPSHANYTYLEKYGIYDHRGGGRASARETVARVAAGAIAKQIIAPVEIFAYIKQIGAIKAEDIDILSNQEQYREIRTNSQINCIDKKAEKKMLRLLKQIREEGDSVGGVIECVILSPPVGLGDPIYEKFEAMLASAMLSIPASKGFEIGDGFGVASMRGSEANDTFVVKEHQVSCLTNHSGGILGGITNGKPIIFRVAFKPTASIARLQKTVNINKEETTLDLDKKLDRHDPCVAIRAVSVIEAMAALVTADKLLYK